MSEEAIILTPAEHAALAAAMPVLQRIIEAGRRVSVAPAPIAPATDSTVVFEEEFSRALVGRRRRRLEFNQRQAAVVSCLVMRRHEFKNGWMHEQFIRSIINVPCDSFEMRRAFGQPARRGKPKCVHPAIGLLIESKRGGLWRLAPRWNRMEPNGALVEPPKRKVSTRTK